MLKIFALFLLIASSSHALQFVLPKENSGSEKKYNLAICSVYKNEAGNLKNWIDHHRNLGVDHFYLYDTGSRDHYMLILFPYISDGTVTLVNWPEGAKQNGRDPYAYALSTQIPAYENAVGFLARDESNWLIFMDLDEYLICPENNLASLLIDYADVPAISINTEIIACSDAQEKIPETEDSRIFDKPVKMIFKPNLCHGFVWPPYQCRFNTELAGIDADRNELRIHHYPKEKNPRLNQNKIHKKNETVRSFVSEISSLDLDNDALQLKRPMYLYMPEFIKRLKALE